MEISSTKGPTSVRTIREAAAWIAEYRPAYVSVDGIDVAYEVEATEGQIKSAIRAALHDAYLESGDIALVDALGDEAAEIHATERAARGGKDE